MNFNRHENKMNNTASQPLPMIQPMSADNNRINKSIEGNFGIFHMKINFKHFGD